MFIENFIRNFANDKQESIDDDHIIPLGFIDIAKPVNFIFLFGTKNVCSKEFTQKFHNCTGSKFDLLLKR